MPITCDDCGQEADISGRPKGIRWTEWLSHISRGDKAMVMLPIPADHRVAVVCKPCVHARIQADKIASA